MIEMRAAAPQDISVLASIYGDSVRTLGPERYSPDQVRIWAGFAEDEAEFRAKVLQSTCVVAEIDSVVVGFGTLEEDGTVGLLYVGAAWGRRGVGSAILSELLALAESRELKIMQTTASEFSRGLFEKFGFRLKDVEQSEYRGVTFTRYSMERTR